MVFSTSPKVVRNCNSRIEEKLPSSGIFFFCRVIRIRLHKRQTFKMPLIRGGISNEDYGSITEKVGLCKLCNEKR